MPTWDKDLPILYDVVDEFTPWDNNQPYGPVAELELKAKNQRWGLELLFAHTAAYTGKVLFRQADGAYQGVMQMHRDKDESFYLLSGECTLRWKQEGGQIVKMRIGPGRAFHIPRFAWHSMIADTDCVFFEVSTPHFEDRQNLEDAYDRAEVKELVE